MKEQVPGSLRIGGDDRFTVSEVEAILRRALHRKRDSGEITRDELFETARELGIATEEVQRAIEDQYRIGLLEDAREEWKQRRKSKFYAHLRAYLIVNGFLMILDLVTTGGVWFYYPMIGWGIGLAFDASSAFHPSEKEIERGARSVLRKQRKEKFRSELNPW